MNLSLNWLRDYIDLTGISTEEIVHQLTMTGLEVEDVTDQSKKYENFVVGYVKEREKHPNADKLSRCVVTDGTEDYQVVCGAPNVAAGQKIIFAKVGAVVPRGNFKIGKAKIRGVESFGMICSEAELEISDNHDGIMVLENGAETGAAAADVLGLNDTLLEIAITPNRPDALSHLGVARDLAAIFNRDIKYPRVSEPAGENSVHNEASVVIEDGTNCPRYAAKVVKGITIKESPDWLKIRLKNIGLRPINNIVDVTNYVMYELGQPLHAFDLDRLAGRKIIVNSTAAETEFTTLDSKTRKLPAGTLMINDGEKPVAIAGVMGGENSEIGNDTKNILIESAYFNPSSVRKTAKSLTLSTEASYRFERGIDPNIAAIAAERAAQLIHEVAGGEAASGIIDVYPNPIEPLEVKLRYSRIERILGYKIEDEKIKSILIRLGFGITREEEDAIMVKVPTYRPDIEREIDIIEEAARIDGYDNIPAVEKIKVTLQRKYDESSFNDRIRNAAVALGFFEMINNPMISEKLSLITGTPVKLLNPLSQDMAVLRTSLIPGALTVTAHNINAGEKTLKLFESGNVFNKKSEGEVKSFDDFTEEGRILFLLTGKAQEKEWNEDEKNHNFYSFKGLINSFIKEISLDNVLNDSYYHDGNTIYDYYFEKHAEGGIAGAGGKLKNEVLKVFGIEQEVYCFEFYSDKLRNLQPGAKRYKEPLKYPKIIRDFAFIFEGDVTHQDVVTYIGKNGSNLLKSVKLFDIFESKSIGEGRKSMAFTLEYYDESRTLKEEEVEKEFSKLIKLIEKNFNAVLRGA